MNINDYLEKYKLQYLEECNEEDAGGMDEINTREVCTNEEGLTLLEYESNIFDSAVCEETIHDLFPEFKDFDKNKGYFIEWNGRIMTD